MKILITGGHVTPALAVIEQLKGQEIVFVGRKYALEHEQTLSFEYKEVTRRNIKFIHLKTGRINRNLSFPSAASFLKIPYGFYQGLVIMRKEKPDVVLTFGGYLAVPIAWWARFFNIPVFLHEQTSIPGKAARLIGKFAKKIFISFPQTGQYFPTDKTILTGNPIRKAIYSVKKRPFKIFKDRSVVYITGGSLGSHSINLHVERLLKTLLSKYIIIHQAGDTRRYHDFEKLVDLKKSLPRELQQRYFLKKHFSEDEIGYIYSLADIIVGRAGANTFFELVLLEKPAVFIPLPWSAEKEQQKQAEMFKEAGVGEIFSQSDQGEHLEQKIEALFKNLSSYKSNFKNLKKLYRENSASVIADEILKI